MSLITARKKRTTLYLSIVGLMIMVAAVSAISARDPSGVSLRVGVIMVAVGGALWLPWRQLIPVVVLAWLVPNLGRSFIDDTSLVNLNMALELPGLAGVAFFTAMAAKALKSLEQESVLIGSGSSDLAGLNPETGIFDESQLKPTLAAELARSRRFGRTFSLVLVGVDEMRQKYDYRDEAVLRASQNATGELLRQTRLNVDRVFHYKGEGFAIILPESTDKDIPGLVKRLRRLARGMKPAEGEPGGPMPVHFGATFFPDCATSVDDLMRRAEVALRIASSNTTRYQLDSAEAPSLPPAETLRREQAEAVTAATATPPPSVSNPVAAAIVDEAYAERAREAETVAEPVLAAAEPVSEADDAGSMTVNEPAAEPVVASVEEPAYETASEPVVASIEEPAYEAPILSAGVQEEAAAIVEAFAEPVAVAGEPVAAPVSSTTEPVPEAAAQPLAATASAAATVSDDFEALLKQMDETLKMIRSVRSQAA